VTQPSPATIEREKPTWVDKARLCFEISQSDRGVDLWVQQGIIPPGRMRGGKLIWRLSEVNACLDRGTPEGQSVEDQVRQRARALRKQA
jgi:hypothetical protein